MPNWLVFLGTLVVVVLAYVAWDFARYELIEPTARVKADRDIRAVLSSQQDAWNRGDLDGFMSGYRMSDDITFYSDDQVRSGWVALRDRYDQRYRKEGRTMGKLSFDDLKLDVLATDGAMVRGKWQLDLDGKTPHGLFTLLVRKYPDGWKIVHDHTSAAPEKKD
jgi:beta-aspartyl-peptidase (threonine type)